MSFFVKNKIFKYIFSFIVLFLAFTVLSVVIGNNITFANGSKNNTNNSNGNFFWIDSNNTYSADFSAMIICNASVSSASSCESSTSNSINYSESTINGNTITFTSGGSTAYPTLTVNICNPSKGTLSGSATGTVNISNYNNALNSAESDGDTTYTCVAQKSSNYSPQNITVNVNFIGLPVIDPPNNPTIGPVSIVLTNTTTNQTISTQQTDSEKVTANAETLVATFKSISPGNYSVCLQNTKVCSSIPESDFVNPIQLNIGLSSSQSNSYISNPKSSQSTPTCESDGGFSLSWLVCPIINWIVSAENDLEGVISNLLQTKTINFNNISPGSGKGYSSSIYSVWNSFRVIANILLVLALLIVVFGESIGGGLLDAYTIRKILPRLILVAIFINLSIYIVSGLEDMVNILGKGIFSLLTSTFKGSGPTITLGAGGSFISGGLTLATVVGLMVVDGPVLLLTALSSFLALLGAIVTIMIRQGLLVLLTIFSPVAFVLYLLPNTEQYFKKWWKLLSETLLVYPIVMSIFALCNISAWVFSQLGGSVDQLFSIVALMAPLFLIPFAFKMAGGAIGGVHDAMTGLRNRAPIAKWKQGLRAQRKEKFETGGFQDRRLGRLYNRLGASKRAGWKGRFGFGETGRYAMGLNSLSSVDDIMKSNPKLARSSDDARAVLGLSGGTEEGALASAMELFGVGPNATEEQRVAAQNRINNAVNEARAIGFSRAKAIAALSLTAQSSSRAIPQGRYDIVQNGINRLSGGNSRLGESLAQGFQFDSRNGLRGDLGGMWTSQAVQDRATVLQNELGINREEAMRHAVALDAMERMEPVNVVRGNANQVQQFMDTSRIIFNAARNPNASNDLKMLGATAAGRILEAQSNLAYAPGGNQDIINNTMYHPQVDVDYNSPLTIEDQLANHLNEGLPNQFITGQELNRFSRTPNRETAAPGQIFNPNDPRNQNR